MTAGRNDGLSRTPLRVLISAEHASAQLGGEAALALHYFRVLRRRGVDVWLLTHSRTRDELVRLFPDEARIHYIEDTDWHRALWRFGQRLPEQVAYLTTGFLSRISTQLAQRRLARRLVGEHGISVIHQPMPVSPREPSLLFGLGAPVIIGPMNGGMDYPEAFRRHRGTAERLLVSVGRASAAAMNFFAPGKRRAAMLLVSNRRTREALPLGTRHRRVVELVENGVDLSLWRAAESPPGVLLDTPPDAIVTFVFMGRLVPWKGVDLLLRAFAVARRSTTMRLWILGDGSEDATLRQMARDLHLEEGPDAPGSVHFAGWLPQAACAEHLKAADCLVLPSLLECGGAVVLEAMSLAKPVIATAWGGPLDYLDAECGILVPPDSAAAIIEGFAAAMTALSQSAATRRRMGQRGLAKVHQEYDWEAKIDRMLTLYDDAAGAAATKRN